MGDNPSLLHASSKASTVTSLKAAGPPSKFTKRRDMQKESRAEKKISIFISKGSNTRKKSFDSELLLRTDNVVRTSELFAVSKMNKIAQAGVCLCKGVNTCVFSVPTQLFSTSPSLNQIIKLSRMKVVDNSMLGRRAELASKPARVIHIYNKKGIGYLGDKVLVAIMGEKKRAYIVGLRQTQKENVPRFDSNNIVLVEDNGTPTGTRIRVPIPSCLRNKEGDFTKILSIATKFV
ncbi:hypothetical protein CHS0354_013778 [Potamilus streckersoni]|uniref:Large ribosomal subunit protein uL14m n=1 Tax=Potamilus streckersoni TaxID=2493646 RepID=A0AAE0SH31_9BIVA|nr:hypothetical protein CHS0354_013778 [Potamilus streckersoni]